jgi:phenylpropionate dioxygenase-like ring-hydroxylating dioxygenase large terminal subunit
MARTSSQNPWWPCIEAMWRHVFPSGVVASSTAGSPSAMMSFIVPESPDSAASNMSNPAPPEELELAVLADIYYQSRKQYILHHPISY